MRTLVVSDLHIGGAPGLFAGAGALAALLDELAGAPLRVVLNGDTFDFPAHAGAGADATSLARAFVEDPEAARVLACLGRAVAAGGALIVRAGEHDGELAGPAAQALVTGGLGLARADATRVAFAVRGAPLLLTVGGARVLVARKDRARERETSRWLAEHLLNPLRRQYGVGLADLLRPDYLGAVTAAFAVNPTAARLVLRELDPAIVGARDERDARLAALLRDTLAGAGLSEREAKIAALALDPDTSLGPLDYQILQRARLKLFRYSLGRRAAAADDGLRALSEREWSALRSLARRGRAAAAVIAHSHVAGWREDDAFAAADTGAWTWSLAAPQADDADAWRRRLDAWQRIARLDRMGPIQAAGAGVTTRFTAALLEPLARGARLVLAEWRPERGLVPLRERKLAPAG